jgi:hypothetical protein
MKGNCACRLRITGFLLGLPWKTAAIRSPETAVDLWYYNTEGRARYRSPVWTLPGLELRGEYSKTVC